MEYQTVELRHVEWKELYNMTIERKDYYESIGSDDTAEWYLLLAGQIAEQVGEQVEE